MEPKKPISHLIAGLIMGAIMIIYSLMLNFLGKGQDKTLGWIAYLLFVGGIIIFVNLYGTARNNDVTFGNLFSYGFKATALATLFILVCLVVIIFAMPDFKQKILDGMREGLEKRGTMSDEQVDQTVEAFSKNFILFMVGGAIFMYLLFGAIGSLVGAAITKKKPVNPLDQMSM